jgi:hypothetical protein
LNLLITFGDDFVYLHDLHVQRNNAWTGGIKKIINEIFNVIFRSLSCNAETKINYFGSEKKIIIIIIILAFWLVFNGFGPLGH